MIRFDAVSKSYSGMHAVKNISFVVPENSLTVLIGPSGCGKSTTLKLMNRMVEKDTGIITYDGTNINKLQPEALRRQMGYVIQNIGLFPHWTVNENIGTVPKLLGWDEPRSLQRTQELLDLIGLDPSIYGTKYPSQLSGGEAQRVGVARALAADPPVLLMDEPFGAVDPITREQLQDEFIRIQRELRKTVVFVTHDMNEAVKLADTIILMQDGEIVQNDSTEELLLNPENTFVRDFVGTDSSIKRLSRFRVEDCMVPATNGGNGHSNGGSRIDIGSDLKAALSGLLLNGKEKLTVVDESGKAVGTISFQNIMAAASK